MADLEVRDWPSPCCCAVVVHGGGQLWSQVCNRSSYGPRRATSKSWLASCLFCNTMSFALSTLCAPPCRALGLMEGGKSQCLKVPTELSLRWFGLKLTSSSRCCVSIRKSLESEGPRAQTRKLRAPEDMKKVTDPRLQLRVPNSYYYFIYKYF